MVVIDFEDILEEFLSQAKKRKKKERTAKEESGKSAGCLNYQCGAAPSGFE